MSETAKPCYDGGTCRNEELVDELVAEVERLRADYSEEVAEFNQGYDAAKNGASIDGIGVIGRDTGLRSVVYQERDE